MYIVLKGTIDLCILWNLQGFTKNFSEAIIDWIFTLRVMYLESDWKYFWVFMFILLDAGPRIVGQFYYSTAMNNNICLLSEPSTERVVKTVMNTVYIGIVAFYFALKIFSIIGPVKSKGAERLESLAFTSIVFALVLCLVRTFCVDQLPIMLPADLLIATTLYLDLTSYHQLLLAFKSTLPLIPKLNPKQFFNSTFNQEFKHSMKINLDYIQDFNQLGIDLLEHDQIHELIKLDVNCKQDLLEIAMNRQIQLFYLIRVQYQNSLYLNSYLNQFYRAYYHLWKYILKDIEPTESLFVSVCLTGNQLAIPLMIDRVEITETIVIDTVKYGQSQIFKLLLPKIDPSFDDNLLIRLAAMQGKYDIVEMLINDDRVRVDQQVLDSAILNKHYDIAGLFLQKYDLILAA
ncbi:hypothetical protein HDV06_000858 [Boothiomyces sp. JEL0866]|nr:hypothetical protein HDV06_000858 [Boothiomyces sp. JEL0866]